MERTPLQRNQPVHLQERAGDTTGVRPHAIPSVTYRDLGGYVGGARLLHNNILARGTGAVTGPTSDGTYGTDYAGFHVRPGRVFLAPSTDPSAGIPFSRGYHTDGSFPKDVFAARPFRKALFEKKEAAAERGLK